VHALSNLGYKRGSRQGLKSATRAAQWRRRWTVLGDASPGLAPFFFFSAWNGVVFPKTRRFI
jgi:hypothetical protein